MKIKVFFSCLRYLSLALDYLMSVDKPLTCIDFILD
jgi:hypothetical protein